MNGPENSRPEDSLRSQLERRFAAERLDDQQFARIERLIKPPRPGRAWRPAIQAAAALVLAVALAWILPLERTGTSGIAERVAQEVITNHIRIKSLDVESDRMEELRTRLDQLDFLPRTSRLVADAAMELRGGRYCTLQGVLATQIVYQGPDSELLTHYQAVYKPHIFGDVPDLDAGQAPLMIRDRGLEVRIWVEDGLLMVSAR